MFASSRIPAAIAPVVVTVMRLMGDNDIAASQLPFDCVMLMRR